MIKMEISCIFHCTCSSYLKTCPYLQSSLYIIAHNCESSSYDKQFWGYRISKVEHMKFWKNQFHIEIQHMFPANMCNIYPSGNGINCPVHSAKDPGLKWLLISLHVMAITLVEVWFSHHHTSSAKRLIHIPVHIHRDWKVPHVLGFF